MRFAEVAVDAPAGHDRTFSYSIPDSLSLLPGHLVEVPFGARTLQGVVFALAETPQVPETRDILRVAGPDPLLAPAPLGLARWVSRHYMCSLFEAASPMLPPGARGRPRTYVCLGPRRAGDAIPRLTPLQRNLLDRVRELGREQEERLVRAFGEGATGAIGRLVDIGALARSAHPGGRGVERRHRAYIRLSDGPDRERTEWLHAHGGRAPRQAALLASLLSGTAPLPLTAARREYGAGAVSALLRRGWLELYSLLLKHDPLAGKEFPSGRGATLTPAQEAAASAVRGALEDPSASPRTFLVHGVTGSGKTEVYLDAVACCLKLGKKAIVLVPEIALTHQTVERFAARFPGEVAVLHSGLTSAQRSDQWWRVSEGEYGVVIGPRSAIFAPQPRPGLVVIDEEHEWTYKQHDAAPRYHARDVALKLAELTGAVVVLGSASPDVQSYHKALSGEFRLLTLPERVSPSADGGPATAKGQPLASVEVVDMRRELREGNRGIFSRALTSAMGECLDSGRQVILFLNRRGSASHMQCRNCGSGRRCRRCDIALTYHRGADRLICHYCGERRIAPARCPKCLSYRLSLFGVGTEAVEDEVARLFPSSATLRWDRDATRTPGADQELLARFKSGEARVLVGTQMVAKGLHFPAVSLVGVVSADVGLNMPDFRAGERAFQLLCQVAGRAGRGPSPGKVIVQTYQPNNYAVQAAARQDYLRFYHEEAAFRQEQSNPPFGRLVRLLHLHTNRALCEREALRFANLIRRQRESWGYPDVEVLGPTPAYPDRLRGRYRWQLMLRGPEPRALLDRVTIPSGWAVDVDPVALT